MNSSARPGQKRCRKPSHHHDGLNKDLTIYAVDVPALLHELHEERDSLRRGSAAASLPGQNTVDRAPVVLMDERLAALQLHASIDIVDDISQLIGSQSFINEGTQLRREYREVLATLSRTLAIIAPSAATATAT